MFEVLVSRIAETGATQRIAGVEFSVEADFDGIYQDIRALARQQGYRLVEFPR